MRAAKAKLGGAGRGVLAIGASSAAGQLISLLAVPVISRLYTPESVGVFASLLALMTIFIIVGPLRLDSALQVASERDVVPILGASILFSVVASAVCLVVVGIHPTLSDILSYPVGALVVMYVVMGAQYNVLSSLVLRTRQYRAIAVRNFLRQASTSVSQVGVVPLMSGWGGLLVGATAGQLVGLLYLLRHAGRYVRGRVRHLLHGKRVARYWRFPLIFAPSAVLNAVGIQVPLLFISAAYDASDAGNLAQAIRVGAVPAVVLGSTLSSVVMAEISARVRSGELDQRSRFMRVSRVLFAAGIVWLLLLLIALPPVLPSILGDGWEDAGRFVRAIAASSTASLVVAPLSVVLVVYERAFTALVLDSLRIILTVGSGAVALRMEMGPVETTLAISLASALVYLATWLFCFRAVSGRH